MFTLSDQMALISSKPLSLLQVQNRSQRVRLSQSSQKTMDGFKQMSEPDLLQEVGSLYSRKEGKEAAIKTTRNSMAEVRNPDWLLKLPRSCQLSQQCPS